MDILLVLVYKLAGSPFNFDYGEFLGWKVLSP